MCPSDTLHMENGAYEGHMTNRKVRGSFLLLEQKKKKKIVRWEKDKIKEKKKRNERKRKEKEEMKEKEENKREEENPCVEDKGKKKNGK